MAVKLLGITLEDKRTTTTCPEIYPQNFSIQDFVVWGSKNQQRRGWDYPNFKKEESFWSHKKLSAI